MWCVEVLCWYGDIRIFMVGRKNTMSQHYHEQITFHFKAQLMLDYLVNMWNLFCPCSSNIFHEVLMYSFGKEGETWWIVVISYYGLVANVSWFWQILIGNWCTSTTDGIWGASESHWVSQVWASHCPKKKKPNKWTKIKNQDPRSPLKNGLRQTAARWPGTGSLLSAAACGELCQEEIRGRQMARRRCSSALQRGSRSAPDSESVDPITDTAPHLLEVSWKRRYMHVVPPPPPLALWPSATPIFLLTPPSLHLHLHLRPLLSPPLRFPLSRFLPLFLPTRMAASVNDLTTLSCAYLPYFLLLPPPQCTSSSSSSCKQAMFSSKQTVYKGYKRSAINLAVPWERRCLPE